MPISACAKNPPENGLAVYRLTGRCLTPAGETAGATTNWRLYILCISQGRRRGATDEDGTFYNLAHEASTDRCGSSIPRFICELADNIAEFGNSADYA
jgi:hypothetical protein